MSRKKIYSKWFAAPALIFFSLFFILPNLFGLVFAFTDWSIFYVGFDQVNFIGLDNFKQLFSERLLLKAAGNTFYFAIVTVVFKNVIGLALALLVNRPFKTKNYLRSVFFLPSILSTMVVAIVFSAIYNPQSGILNGFLNNVGLGFLAQEWLTNPKIAMTSICAMEIWQGTGLTMIIYLAGLQTVPKEYYESADLDGTTGFQKFRYITVPLILPTFTVNITLTLINGLKVFGQVYALTSGGPADATQVFQTFVYKYFSQGLLGYSSAAGLVFTVVIMVVSLTLTSVMRKKEVSY